MMGVGMSERRLSPWIAREREGWRDGCMWFVTVDRERRREELGSEGIRVGIL